MLYLNHRLSAPVSAQLEITDACNHRCPHCYILSSDPIIPAKRTIVDDSIVLSIAQQLIEWGVFSVVLTGGEPMMKKPLLRRLVDLFTSNGLVVSVNTNLTLADDDIISFLKEKRVSILTSCPSLTSYNRLTGTTNVNLFTDRLIKVLDAGIHCSVNMVITKENLPEIIPTARRLKEMGCTTFGATPMSQNVDSPRFDLAISLEELNQVFADLLWVHENLKMRIDIFEALPKCAFPKDILMKDYPFLYRKCQAGISTVSVSCNGDVRPCGHNPNTYGNLLKDRPMTIWNGMSDWQHYSFLPKECTDCCIRDICNGGCRTNAKATFGQWNSPDPWYTQALTKPIRKESKSQCISNITEDSVFLINKNFGHRTEEDNTIVIYDRVKRSFFVVNSELFRFIDYLWSLPESRLSFGQIIALSHHSKKAEIIDVIKYLISHRIITVLPG